MSALVQIELWPAGIVLLVERSTPLQDVLFAQGVEFPCGGHGRCKGCRIQVRRGTLAPSPEDKQRLTAAELVAGWRLACRARATSDLQLELAQWDTAILSDESVFEFTPQEGLGIAVDIGTTTLVAQLIDLQTGKVRAVRTALNNQAKHGADIMSRVAFAVASGGQEVLRGLIRNQLGQILSELQRASHNNQEQIRKIVLVGNTVMHHLFCGISLEQLSHLPFESDSPGMRIFRAAELGWEISGNPAVHFLPCLGGFVGSDILAGILATKLHEQAEVSLLIDLGTNGEIVVGNRDRMLCASTAAGPAFEGARISMGMRAAFGAISEVKSDGSKLLCHVLGDVPARGICGSGLVDAVAAGLELGWIRPSGRLANGEFLALVEPVSLSQTDVRELQLAKGAIAAGVRLLMDQWGATEADLHQIYLAGAFGNYINYSSARRIGLLTFPPEKVIPAGNTALLGAKLALFGLDGHQGAYPELLPRIRHVSLHEDPHFHDAYVEQMSFPAVSG